MKRLVGILGLLLTLSCGITNTNPPAYIKQVAAYKEGSDGIVVYFVLADAQGAMTATPGTVALIISETHSEMNKYTYKFDKSEIPLFEVHHRVEAANFQSAKVGLGAFQHEVLLCSLGRIPYTSFSRSPSETTGKITVEFTRPDGKTIKGEDTIFF